MFRLTYIQPFNGSSMRVLVQRCGECEVWIDSRLYSQTKPGLLLLFGTRVGDQPESAIWLADKVVNLRIFEDDQEKMNLSALDVKAEIMIVSQFTLYADCRKGRRPSFGEAMDPSKAEKLYDQFVELVADSGLVTRTGQFGATMDIKFTNHGPVTIPLEHEL